MIRNGSYKTADLKKNFFLLTCFFIAFTGSVLLLTLINNNSKINREQDKGGIGISLEDEAKPYEEPQVFRARYKPPNRFNRFYYTDKNIFYRSGFGMPNCTAYAYGRAYELLKYKPDLCENDAKDWWDYNNENKIFPSGQKPKIGSVACWSSDTFGHVAVVEAIEGDTIFFSNSGYDYLNFYITTASISDENPGQSNWQFQGYIYLGDFIPDGREYTWDEYMV